MAFKDLVRATEVNPNNWTAFLNLSTVAWERGEKRLASQSGDTALELNPKLANNARVRHQIGNMKIENGEYADLAGNIHRLTFRMIQYQLLPHKGRTSISMSKSAWLHQLHHLLPRKERNGGNSGKPEWIMKAHYRWK